MRRSSIIYSTYIILFSILFNAYAANSLSTCVVIHPENWETPHFKILQDDFDSLKQEVKQCNPNIIVHLAARTEVEKSFTEQLSFSEINYLGTVNLIESTRQLENLFTVSRFFELKGSFVKVSIQIHDTLLIKFLDVSISSYSENLVHI